MDNAKQLKDKASRATQQAIDYSAQKLADSKFTITSIDDLEEFIQKSKTTTGTDSDTWKKKEFQHRAIVIFVDTGSEFFKSLLYKLPVLQTKAFSQNIALRLADISMKKLDKKEYQIGREETLLVFENMKITKVLSWQENIQKVVKSMSLDINKSIEEL